MDKQPSASISSNNTPALKWVSIGLLLFATLAIFAIAQAIHSLLASYDIGALYISFCAGFILFTPLVSLLLHPLAVRIEITSSQSYLSTLLANIGLVIFVQILFFLIWMTDAIALYSIYVDQTSFLAKAFNISGENKGEFSKEFFAFNVLLAWFFSVLSIAVGLLPCLIARIKNHGVIGNFVESFSFIKRHKMNISAWALLLALSVLLPLMYMKYVFIISFPTVLLFSFKSIAKAYVLSKNSRVTA